MIDHRLTTKDNPYDPFDQFSEWYMFDVQHGYNSCELLTRIGYFPESLTEAEIYREKDRAIDEILKNVDFMGIYKKVSRKVS